jgi:hypothetical protein
MSAALAEEIVTGPEIADGEPKHAPILFNRIEGRVGC